MGTWRVEGTLVTVLFLRQVFYVSIDSTFFTTTHIKVQKCSGLLFYSSGLTSGSSIAAGLLAEMADDDSTKL